MLRKFDRVAWATFTRRHPERLRPAAERHGFSDQQLKILRLLFYPEGYAVATGLDPSLEPDEIFLHYLENGVSRDIAPGPLFDRDFCRKLMGSSEPIVSAWLNLGAKNAIVPTPLFDRLSYLEDNKDVADAGVDPFLHYLEYGRFEHRAPSVKISGLIRLLDSYGGDVADPLWRVLSLLPAEATYIASDEKAAAVLNQLVDRDFYRAQLPYEVDVTPDQLAAHFLVEGTAIGARPCILFNEECYRKALSQRKDCEHYNLSDARNTADGSEGQLRIKNFFLHWLYYGFGKRIVPTPIFDEQYYLDSNPDLRTFNDWLFIHFALYGLNEGRPPNPFLIVDQVQQSAQPTDRCGRLSLGSAFDHTRIPNPPDLRKSSRLEVGIEFFHKKMNRLKTPEMQALISHAASIEPLVMTPLKTGYILWPPMRHFFAPIAEAGRRVRAAVRRTHYDKIVLIPECMTSGSTRVGGKLVQHLRELNPDEKILLVLTDNSNFEYPDWFGGGYDLLDLANLLRDVEPQYRVRLLLDLVRGLRPKLIFNVNSRLTWDLILAHGKQLATEMQLFTYLFTWDLDRFGNKAGYPIEFFELGFDHLTRVVIDNQTLKDELVQRYVMSPRLQDRLRVIYTPADKVDYHYSENFAARRAEGRPLHCFWIGRFDRQKRFDLVLDIARRRPDIAISAWGKTVLGHPSLDISNIPPNLSLLGTYRDFEELPLSSFDFFLYTSQWDGMPTILVDCGRFGIPVVASRVGGVGEMIDESTGWPVDDALNPDAYIETIDAMTRQPAEVSRRALALYERVRVMFGSQQYRQGLADAIGGSKWD